LLLTVKNLLFPATLGAIVGGIGPRATESNVTGGMARNRPEMTQDSPGG
jgi:hypothetical protein